MYFKRFSGKNFCFILWKLNFSTPPLFWAWCFYVLVSVGFVNVSIPESFPLLSLPFLSCPGQQVGTCPLWWGWTRGPGTCSSSFPFFHQLHLELTFISFSSLPPAREISYAPFLSFYLCALVCKTEISVCMIDHLPNCSPEASWKGRKG